MVRMAMTIADDDPAKAKTLFEAAEPNAISSSADDVLFKYLAASPNTNPIWNDIVQSGRQDYVAAKPLLDYLKDNADPRLSLYYRYNNETDKAFVGGVVGGGNTFSSVSKPSAKVAAPDFPAVLFDYAEMEFYRAEAKERGFTVAGTAAEHYNNAITASILSWGGSAADAATYLADADVVYSSAAWKQKIGTQKWIALYNRPFEGWTEIRRLDFPVLALPLGNKSGFPNRLAYPGNEQQLNGTNYTAAAAAIGGDKVETKLFWDKL